MLHRPYALTMLLTSASFALLQTMYPFPGPSDNPLLMIIVGVKPMVYATMKLAWAFVLFMLPGYVWFAVARKLSRTGRAKVAVGPGVLPPYPNPATRRELFVIIGELHHQDNMTPSATPQWCEIPDAGLSHGVLVLGAIGTGKTSSCLRPIADQIFAYEAHDRSRRCGGLVLEVKTDFCKQIQQTLTERGRAMDYMEIGHKSPYVYNPLHNDSTSSVLASGLMSGLRLARGRSGSKDSKFWDDASEGLATFLIELHRLLFGYVTYRDIYLASSKAETVDELVSKLESSLSRDYILVAKEEYLKLPSKVARQLDSFGPDGSGEHLRLELSDELMALLRQHSIPNERVGVEADAKRREAVKSVQVYHEKLKALSPELRTNIAETLNVALLPFDMDLEIRRIFCPPKAAYDPDLNRDCRHGRPLPPLEQLIETPAVLALALPASGDKAARIASVMLKRNWMDAVLRRKSSHGWDPQRSRKLLLMIDEYHALATAGGSDDGGDEKFLNLCRDVLCIPVLATQSLSSLRSTVGDDVAVITQGLQTRICLRQADPHTAEWLSRLVGRKEILKEHWSVSEGQSNVVTSLTGGLVAPQGSMNMSRGWNEQKDSIFEPSFIHELPDGVAVACVYNGFAQLPPSLLFLQQHGQDHRVSWFRMNGARRKGAVA